MYSVTILPWLLQAWLTAGSAADFAAESLLKYSNAENTVWHSDRMWDEVVAESDRWGDEAVGLSQKHEQYLPAPPGFLRDSRAAFTDGDSSKESQDVVPNNKFMYGLKDSSLVHRPRASRQQFAVRLVLLQICQRIEVCLANKGI